MYAGFIVGAMLSATLRNEIGGSLIFRYDSRGKGRAGCFFLFSSHEKGVGGEEKNGECWDGKETGKDWAWCW